MTQITKKKLMIDMEKKIVSKVALEHKNFATTTFMI
jgi:hypothetical protein